MRNHVAQRLLVLTNYMISTFYNKALKGLVKAAELLDKSEICSLPVHALNKALCSVNASLSSLTRGTVLL